MATELVFQGPRWHYRPEAQRHKAQSTSMLHVKLNGFPDEEINIASEFGIRIQVLYIASSKSVVILTKLK